LFRRNSFIGIKEFLSMNFIKNNYIIRVLSYRNGGLKAHSSLGKDS